MDGKGAEDMTSESGELHHLRDLLAYMLGVPRNDVDVLLRQYAQSGGSDDAAALFSWLTARGRHYVVLWGLIPHTEDISIVLAAVAAPDHSILWRGVSAVAYGHDSGSFKLWNRVLELAGGASALTPPKVSESDLWSGEQAAKQISAIWNGLVGGVYGEIETLFPHVLSGGSKAGEIHEDVSLTRKVGATLDTRMREISGRSFPITALRFVMVALPELRELGLGLRPLQQAIDSYADLQLSGSHRRLGQDGEHAAGGEGAGEAKILLPESNVRHLEPVLDPILGIGMSDIVPGELLLLHGEGENRDPVPGRVYMIRVLRDGRFELHGRTEGPDGSFFKYVAPGDIRVALAGTPLAAETRERGVLWPLFTALGIIGVLLWFWF